MTESQFSEAPLVRQADSELKNQVQFHKLSGLIVKYTETFPCQLVAKESKIRYDNTC